MSTVYGPGSYPSVAPVTNQSRAADNVRAQDEVRERPDQSQNSSLDPNQLAATISALQPSQVVNQPVSPQTPQDQGDGLLSQLRQQLTVSAPTERITPPEQKPESFDRQIVPVNNHQRPAQSGVSHATSQGVGQYAAIYNSTALALDRTSLTPIATERPQITEVRVQTVS